MVLKVFHFISAKTSSSSPSSLKFLHEITLNCPSSLSSEKLKTQNWKLTFFLETYHQSSIPLVLLNQVSSSPCWAVWKITLSIDNNDEYIENVGSSEIWNCRLIIMLNIMFSTRIVISVTSPKQCVHSQTPWWSRLPKQNGFIWNLELQC